MALLRHADDGEFLAHLRATPLGQKITGAITDERTAARSTMIERRVELEKAGTEERKRFENELEAAQLVVKQAEDKFKAALAAARDVLARHDAYRHSAEAELSKLDNDLQKTAPAAIADFMKWASDEHYRTLQTPILGETIVTDQTDKNTLRKIVVLKTNAKDISARAAALLAAKATAAQLALSVAAPDEIVARITELRNGIPTA